MPEFVRRRHAELRARGLDNDGIFDAIAAELAAPAVRRPGALRAAAAPPRLRLTGQPKGTTPCAESSDTSGPQDAAPILLEGLGRLEYRGYDSAGVAVLRRSGLKVRKAAGRVRRPRRRRCPARFKGTLGIGHTRWATHGEPTDVNAHPHTDAAGRIAVVHNGIIENAAELRAELERRRASSSRSETDTEVLAHLIAPLATAPTTSRSAVRQALRRVEGTYGIAVIDAEHPDRIVVARNGSPVLLGIGEQRDVRRLRRRRAGPPHPPGRLPRRRRDGHGHAPAASAPSPLDDRPTAKSPATVDVGRRRRYDRGDHEHFMLKEILEQPEAVERTLRGRLDERFGTAHLGGLNLTPREPATIRRVKILGCGSAYYAGQLGAQLIEDLARMPADAEPASEFRYRNPVIEPDTLYIAVSQSGETARHAGRGAGGAAQGRPGARHRQRRRLRDRARVRRRHLHARRARRSSVASTKAFTYTVVGFALLALHLGRIRDLSPADGQRLDRRRCSGCPSRSREILRRRATIADDRRASSRRRAERCSSSAASAATRSPARARRS